MIQKLTSTWEDNAYFIIWRIIALSEIPYAIELEYTKKLVEKIREEMITPTGISPTGIENEIVPCYNAMLIESFCKLGFASEPFVKNAVNWIVKYQNYEPNEKSKWNGRTTNHRLCLADDEPCYIGIVKSTKALLTYLDYSQDKDNELNQYIEKGVNVILKHRGLEELSDRMRSYQTIKNISFPQSYKLGIIEIIEVLYKTKNINKAELKNVLEYLNEKKLNTGGWKRDYKFTGKGYVSFDDGRRQGEWVTYFLDKYTKLI